MDFRKARGPRRKRQAGLIGLAALLLVPFVTLAQPIDEVYAAVPPNPHVNLFVEKTFDGTGHNTDTASFVNTANGFVPGDDTPDDGVVSSHDLVGYEVTLQIKSGLART